MKDQEQFIQKEELIQLVEYDFTNKRKYSIKQRTYFLCKRRKIFKEH